MINPSKTRGFTLIELLVVISIISLLSSVVLASLSSARLKARDIKRAQDILQIRNALELYYAQNGSYPSQPANFSCGTFSSPAGLFVSTWTSTAGIYGVDPAMLAPLAPYLKTRPINPGSTVIYITDTQTNPKNYKLSITKVENTNNVPASLIANPGLIGGDSSLGLDNPINIWSSDTSKTWNIIQDCIA